MQLNQSVWFMIRPASWSVITTCACVTWPVSHCSPNCTASTCYRIDDTQYRKFARLLFSTYSIIVSNVTKY